LKNNQLPVSGTKKEIIQRILDHFDGKKPVSRKRKATGSKKKSPAQKRARKASTEKEDVKKDTKKVK